MNTTRRTTIFSLRSVFLVVVMHHHRTFALSSLRWRCSNHNYLHDLSCANSVYHPEDYKIMALGSKTWLGVNNNGLAHWGSGVPKYLDNKLRGRQNWLPHVSLVCFQGGTGDDDESYFVQFEDGKSQWFGLSNSPLDKYVDDLDSGVVTCIALGANDSFYCQWEDGSSAWSGLPTGLYHKLNGRQKCLPPVKNINLGPNDEWFVILQDKKWECQGMSESCTQAINEIHNDEGDIHDIQFGGNYGWLISYTI
ncbi:hypothetical protein ACA910_015614 [Epithemia clementina (nom. ined.)]